MSLQSWCLVRFLAHLHQGNADKLAWHFEESRNKSENRLFLNQLDWMCKSKSNTFDTVYIFSK